MDDHSAFKRYAFTYPSDGLKIYGFMDVPRGEGPFPVIIMLHGKSPPASYSTLDYSTPYADELAGAGYLVLHPNLRNYPPSDAGDNLYRVGMAIDVLNLIALVKTQGGQLGPLSKADPARIGLWGHSMGGGIVLKVITISRDIKAALLYAPLSGDEKLNFEKFFNGSDNPQAAIERQTSPIGWFHISPSYYLNNITAAVSIHQGGQDDTVPPEWTDALCERLRALGKTVFCVNYPDMGHAFSGMTDKRFRALAIIFFKNYLARPAP
jgi:dipeptidyl aminopeptidase/acylaminoacyl peptidase